MKIETIIAFLVAGIAVVFAFYQGCNKPECPTIDCQKEIDQLRAERDKALNEYADLVTREETIKADLQKAEKRFVDFSKQKNKELAFWKRQKQKVKIIKDTIEVIEENISLPDYDRMVDQLQIYEGVLNFTFADLKYKIGAFCDLQNFEATLKPRYDYPILKNETVVDKTRNSTISIMGGFQFSEAKFEPVIGLGYKRNKNFLGWGVQAAYLPESKRGQFLIGGTMNFGKKKYVR